MIEDIKALIESHRNLAKMISENYKSVLK